MTLTKAELYEILIKKMPKITKSDLKIIIELFFEEIKLALEKGENVKISGFGKFNIKNKKPRPGRNPKTGVEVVITARRVVTFHASYKLKNNIVSKLPELQKSKL